MGHKRGYFGHEGGTFEHKETREGDGTSRKVRDSARGDEEGRGKAQAWQIIIVLPRSG